MSEIKNTHLAELIDRVETQKRRARDIAGTLNSQQIEWNPPEGGWSIGQILEHLIESAEAYRDAVPNKIQHARVNGLLAVDPGWKRSFFGSLLIKSLQSPRKVKTAKRFDPQEVKPDVLQRFVYAQDMILGFMREADGVDINRPRVSSPFMSLIRYNLADYFAIHTTHNDRHLNRAEEIRNKAEFPTSKP